MEIMRDETRHGITRLLMATQGVIVGKNLKTVVYVNVHKVRKYFPAAMLEEALNKVAINPMCELTHHITRRASRFDPIRSTSRNNVIKSDSGTDNALEKEASGSPTKEGTKKAVMRPVT